MNLEKCNNCASRYVMCFNCVNNEYYRKGRGTHDDYIRKQLTNKMIKQLEQQIEEHKNIVTEYDEYNKGKLEAYEHSLELIKNCFNTEQ